MILTIDTDKESPERLRQIARFLQTLSGSSPAVDSSVTEPDPESSAEMFSLLGADTEDDSDDIDAKTASVVSDMLRDADSSRVTPY